MIIAINHIKNIGDLTKIINVTLSLKCYPIVYIILLVVSIISFIICVVKYIQTTERILLHKFLIIIFGLNTFLLLTNMSSLEIFKIFSSKDNAILLEFIILFENLGERFIALQYILLFNIFFTIIPLFYLYTIDIERNLINSDSEEQNKKLIFGIDITNIYNAFIHFCIKMRAFLDKDTTDHYVEDVLDIDYTKISKDQRNDDNNTIVDKNEDDILSFDEEDNEQMDKTIEMEYDEENDEIVFIEKPKEIIMTNSKKLILQKKIRKVK